MTAPGPYATQPAVLTLLSNVCEGLAATTTGARGGSRGRRRGRCQADTHIVVAYGPLTAEHNNTAGQAAGTDVLLRSCHLSRHAFRLVQESQTAADWHSPTLCIDTHLAFLGAPAQQFPLLSSHLHPQGTHARVSEAMCGSPCQLHPHTRVQQADRITCATQQPRDIAQQTQSEGDALLARSGSQTMCDSLGLCSALAHQAPILAKALQPWAGGGAGAWAPG